MQDKRPLSGLFLALFFPLSGALATKPCAPGSWFANQGRTGQEWRANARWVAVGKIGSIKHDVRPYANCALKDPGACASFNHARFTFVVRKVEKGEAVPGARLDLEARYCAKPVPADLDTDKSYRFYGDSSDSFITYEVVPAPGP